MKIAPKYSIKAKKINFEPFSDMKICYWSEFNVNMNHRRIYSTTKTISTKLSTDSFIIEQMKREGIGNKTNSISNFNAVRSIKTIGIGLCLGIRCVIGVFGVHLFWKRLVFTDETRRDASTTNFGFKRAPIRFQTSAISDQLELKLSKK